MPAVAGASSTIRISLPQWRVQEADTSQIELRATEDDGGEKVEILCTGSADYDRQRLAVSCDYGDVGRLEMIAVRDTMHVRGRDVLGVRGTGRGWLEAPGDGLPSELSPPHLLAMLRGASQQTERLVDEEVRGVETRRYRLEVECEKVELDCSGMTSAEVWIDDDGSLRRVWLDDESGAETIEFFDSGADVAIVPPRPTRSSRRRISAPRSAPRARRGRSPSRRPRVSFVGTGSRSRRKGSTAPPHTP